MPWGVQPPDPRQFAVHPASASRSLLSCTLESRLPDHMDNMMVKCGRGFDYSGPTGSYDVVGFV